MNLFNSLRNISLHQDPLEKIGTQTSPVKPENQFQASIQLDTGSLKREATQAVAAGLTLGLSTVVVEGRNLLKLGVGALITSIGELDKKSRGEAVQFFQNFRPNHEQIADRIAVTTAEGAKLDGMILKPQTPPQDPQKYVIWLNGFGQSYEAKLGMASEYADKTGANVLIFNYRGAGDSTGHPTSANDFVRDTLSMVEFLKSKNVAPENITIHGYSMGGGIGAKAAALSPGVKHINDRSFLVFSDATKTEVQRFLQDSTGKKIAKFLGGLGGLIIRSTGFEMNTEKVYKKSNQSSDKRVSDLSERTLVLHHTHDDVIHAEHAFLNNAHLSKRVEVIDLAEKGVDYNKRNSNEAKHLDELGNIAKEKYGAINFEEFKESFYNTQKRNATNEDYKTFLIGKLNGALNTGLLGDTDILEIKNMLGSLENTHGTFAFESKEAASRIATFVSGRPFREDLEDKKVQSAKTANNERIRNFAERSAKPPQNKINLSNPDKPKRINLDEEVKNPFEL